MHFGWPHFSVIFPILLCAIASQKLMRVRCVRERNIRECSFRFIVRRGFCCHATLLSVVLQYLCWNIGIWCSGRISHFAQALSEINGVCVFAYSEWVFACRMQWNGPNRLWVKWKKSKWAPIVHFNCLQLSKRTGMRKSASITTNFLDENDLKSVEIVPTHGAGRTKFEKNIKLVQAQWNSKMQNPKHSRILQFN